MDMSESHSLKRRNTQERSVGSIKRPDLKVTPDVSKKLCARCNNIPWKQSANEVPTSANGNLIAKIIATHDELRVSTCLVCQALALIKPASLDGKQCHLRSYSARRVFGRVASNHKSKQIEATDSSILGVTQTGKSHTTAVDHGFLAVVDRDPKILDFGPREIQAREIDFSLVKEWMSFCSSKHAKSSCTPDSPGDLQDLRVIDCATRSVVPAPLGCHYVALSYVWGTVQPNQEAAISSSLFPLVVEDSISVTVSLGYQYLWVDRYCVGQNDNQKHIQLHQMDKIYSCAQLTLVTAAGENADYGLPGVSSRFRRPQASLEVHGATILQIFPHPAAVLKKWSWSRRGWTYQEGYLSNKRLIFTDTQLSFLCNGMHVAESVRTAPFALNCFDNIPFLNFMPSQEQIQSQKSGGSSHKLRGVSQFISEYSSRQLTYDSDVVLALLGVFRVLERRRVYHIWGVPYEISERQKLRLDWHHEVPSTRRVGFPTWSWTGWTGSARINDTFQDWPHFDVDVGPEVLFIATWEWTDDFYGSEGRPSPTLPEYRYVHPANAPRGLVINGPLVQLSFQKVEWSKQQKDKPTIVHRKYLHSDLKEDFYKIRRQDGLHAILPITSDIVALGYVYMDESRESVLTGETIYGAAFCNYHFGGGVSKWQYLIILRLVGNGDIFQRIGLVRVRHYSIRSSQWSHPDNSPMGYIDSSGKVLDEIDADSFRGQPLWLEKAARRTIKLQ